MIKTINYKGNIYPEFQSEGNAAQFAIPYAKHVCIGRGVDVGCNRTEWAFPGSIPVDPVINGYDALNFPESAKDLDYIFSSHCLEHVNEWVSVLDYWSSRLKCGGTLFLYLPDYSQVYWRPWNNRKHLNIFTPSILKDYLEDRKFVNIFTSETDLNNAFMIMAEKQ
jgi:predicted SAM-dependent methyltransferase